MTKDKNIYRFFYLVVLGGSFFIPVSFVWSLVKAFEFISVYIPCGKEFLEIFVFIICLIFVFVFIFCCCMSEQTIERVLCAIGIPKYCKDEHGNSQDKKTRKWLIFQHAPSFFIVLFILIFMIWGDEIGYRIYEKQFEDCYDNRIDLSSDTKGKCGDLEVADWKLKDDIYKCKLCFSKYSNEHPLDRFCNSEECKETGCSDLKKKCPTNCVEKKKTSPSKLEFCLYSCCGECQATVAVSPYVSFAQCIYGFTAAEKYWFSCGGEPSVRPRDEKKEKPQLNCVAKHERIKLPPESSANDEKKNLGSALVGEQIATEALKAELDKANAEIRQRQDHEHDLLWYKLMALGLILAAVFKLHDPKKSLQEVLHKPFTVFILLSAVIIMLLMDIRFMWNLTVGADIGRWILEVEKCIGIGINSDCFTGSNGKQSQFFGSLGYESWMHKDSPGNEPPSVKLMNTKSGSIFLLTPTFFSLLVFAISWAGLRGLRKKGSGYSQNIERMFFVFRVAISIMAGMLASLYMSFVTGVGYNNWGTITLHGNIFILTVSVVASVLRNAHDFEEQQCPKKSVFYRSFLQKKRQHALTSALRNRK